MYLERKEFINKGASLATICVTSTAAFLPAIARSDVVVGLCLASAYKGGARAVLYRRIPRDPVSGIRDPRKTTVLRSSWITDPAPRIDDDF
jgi:hypothetical protein